MNKYFNLLIFFAAAVSVAGCSGALRYQNGSDSAGGNNEDITFTAGESYETVATYYADYYHGRATSSGEIYDREKLTAASPFIPLKTYVKVTNLKNGKSVVVRVNDRCICKSEKAIDLSFAAAREIDMIRDGVVPVRIDFKDN
ncbi:MAG: septal ring lytic transglycosylase RlpA family protein [Ignavibacteriaceae bacterium]|nr:septal ring lytic transglycosylase RlpA family protein [Ignavibacteriaceae bacterium]NUM69557.1 septal ring lytic transglycosylase RlpA family protein [Ignavibacteriaceae bacterium]